ncbi:MAG: NAD(P)-dependent dehydrogenase (short-subunit alcohol dehydrogenase family) [Myxococcota bacterium]|jgi:NAD(P)-dependent dehydrogenase (short-subunit alcohol dehydrogenase family)
METKIPNSSTVVVTGASTGIGHATCLALAAQGFTVYAGVRKQVDFDKWAGVENIRPLMLDVCNAEQIKAAAAQVASECIDGIDGLVNNAGIAVAAPLACIPLDAFEKQMDVNVTGLLRVSQAFIPQMKRGARLVNMSSMAGKISFPGLGAYHASKHAVEAISDTLRLELKSSGIAVSVIQPGRIATPIWTSSIDTASEILKRIPQAAFAPYKKLMDAVARSVSGAEHNGAAPSLCAEAVHKALTARRPRSRYAVGRDAKLLMFLKRFLLSDKMWDKLVLKDLKY